MISAAPSAIISRRFRTLQSCGAPRYGAPTFAHQVRDENSMIMAAANNARIDGDKAMMEASSPSGAPALTAADVFRAARGAEAAHEVRPVPDDSALWLNLVATTRRTNRNASPCGQVVTHRLQCDTAIANPARCEDHEGLSLPFEGMIAKVGGKRHFLDQQRQNGFELLHVLATLFDPPHIALELAGPNRRQHIRCPNP
jgi:hypothetical protein